MCLYPLLNRVTALVIVVNCEMVAPPLEILNFPKVDGEELSANTETLIEFVPSVMVNKSGTFADAAVSHLNHPSMVQTFDCVVSAVADNFAFCEIV